MSSLDVEQARSQRATTAATVPLLESNLAATANAISTLIGEPPGRVLELLARLATACPSRPRSTPMKRRPEYSAAGPTCAAPRRR